MQRDACARCGDYSVGPVHDPFGLPVARARGIAAILPQHLPLAPQLMNDAWILIDTETTGMSAPIAVVELAAQKMRGWKRDGAPLRLLLNHDVPIEPQAERLHGYSREFLRENGMHPPDAYEIFRTYAADLPLVSHNLAFDWDRVLAPEFEWLGIPPVGRRGFCALTLARRVVFETSSYRLEALAASFFPHRRVEHQALADLNILAELFESVYAPRLAHLRFPSFDSIVEFSRRTPVASCLDLVHPTRAEKPSTSSQVPELAKIVARHATSEELKKAARELREFCRGLVADRVLNPKEFVSLYQWLEACPYADRHPLSLIARVVEKAAADGVVTGDELTDLQEALDVYISI